MLLDSKTHRGKARDQVLNKIPIFLAKTYRIVDNPEYRQIVEWTSDGEAFVVKNVNRLTTEVFTQHFKHNNFLSFIRQLNMYGFHKVPTTHEGEGSVWKHQYFRRDDFSLLPLIKRKNTGEQEGQIVAVTNREERLEKEVSLLRGQHEELQSMMEVLVEQNKSITAQNKAFLTVMTDMRQKYRKKLQTLMLLFLFGKKNKPDEFLFPPQLSNLIDTFQQINNGPGLRMLSQKKRQNNNGLPMLTQGEESHFYSEGERSELASNFDKDESEDIFKVLNRSKSNSGHVKKEEEQKKVGEEEEIWKNGIPISPLSVRSMPQQPYLPNEWDQEMLRKLQNSDNEAQSQIKI